MSSSSSLPINDQIAFELTYAPKRVLTATQIEYGGQVFDCNTCTYSLCCNTVDSISNPKRPQCYKCSCQNKGSTKCSRSGTCDAFVAGCCTCTDKLSNLPIYDPVRTETKTCTEALALQASGAIISNTAQVTALCNADNRRNCCLGIGTQALCGSFWGPTNESGNCDSIMTEYCASSSHAAEQVCNCLNSDLPAPECVDKLCANTSAFKTATMTANNCQINSQICQQFVNLSPSAQNNLLIDSPIVQNCVQNNEAVASEVDGITAAKARQNAIKWTFISLGIIIGVAALGLGIWGAVVGIKKYNVWAKQHPLPKQKIIVKKKVKRVNSFQPSKK